MAVLLVHLLHGSLYTSHSVSKQPQCNPVHPVATTNYMGPWKHTRHFRVYTAVSPGSTKDLLSALTSTNRIEVVLIT